jgi:hypothetical protein
MQRVWGQQRQIEPPQVGLRCGDITRSDLHPVRQAHGPQIEVGEVRLCGLARDLVGPDACAIAEENSAAAKSLTISPTGPASRKASARAFNGSMVNNATRILASK